MPGFVCVHDVVLATLQQAVVGLDLLLQATLDVQEGLVLLVLALHFRSDLSQPLLHAGDLVLQLSQVFVVATFGLRQRGFQVFFLRTEQTQVPGFAAGTTLLARAGAGNCRGIPYHGELGLYIDFQGLQLTSQLSDLLVAGLDLLAACDDLQIHLLYLQSQKRTALSSPPHCISWWSAPPHTPPVP